VSSPAAPLGLLIGLLIAALILTGRLPGLPALPPQIGSAPTATTPAPPNVVALVELVARTGADGTRISGALVNGTIYVVSFSGPEIVITAGAELYELNADNPATIQPGDRAPIDFRLPGLAPGTPLMVTLTLPGVAPADYAVPWR
jgi:hypothetical protein